MIFFFTHLLTLQRAVRKRLPSGMAKPMVLGCPMIACYIIICLTSTACVAEVYFFIIKEGKKTFSE